MLSLIMLLVGIYLTVTFGIVATVKIIHLPKITSQSKLSWLDFASIMTAIGICLIVLSYRI